MKFKKNSILATTLIFILNVAYSTENYVVEKGDALIQILKTIKINPEITKTNGNLLYVKMKLLLAEKKIAAAWEPGREMLKNIVTVFGESTTDRNRAPSLADTPSFVKKDEPFISTNETLATDPEEANLERSPSGDFQQSFFWKVSPIVGWKSLSSTDENIYRKSNITALSNTSYGASFTYGMHIKENIDLFSDISSEAVNFLYQWEFS